MSQVITLPPRDREREIEKLCRVMAHYEPGKPVNVKLSIARPERTPP